MWFWNGTYWQFISMAGPWYQLTYAGTPSPQPKQTIHEAPLAVPEYLARIREKCD